MMRDVMAYWSRNVERISVGRYHVEKVGHSLLIAAGLSACGIPSLLAVILAVMGYLFIGKCMVDSRPSLDWIADGIIGAFAVAAERLLHHDLLGLWIAGVLWVLYCVCVLWRRWASP